MPSDALGKHTRELMEGVVSVSSSWFNPYAQLSLCSSTCKASSVATCAAVSRRIGSACRQLTTKAHSAGFRSGSLVCSDGATIGSPWAASSTGGRGNGDSPVSSSQAITPKLNTSAGAPAAWEPPRHSGAMYIGDPTMTPGREISILSADAEIDAAGPSFCLGYVPDSAPSLALSAATPKSNSLMRGTAPSSATKMLLGRRSR